MTGLENSVGTLVKDHMDDIVQMRLLGDADERFKGHNRNQMFATDKKEGTPVDKSLVHTQITHSSHTHSQIKYPHLAPSPKNRI